MNLDWMEQGLCAQVDTDLFFPDVGSGTRLPKQVCNGNPKRGIAPCPVREQCLRYALDGDIRFGVYGGLSDRERRALKAEEAT